MLSMKLPPKVELESIEFLDSSNPRVRNMAWDVSVDVAEQMRRRSSMDYYLDLEEVRGEANLDKQVTVLGDFLKTGSTSPTHSSALCSLAPMSGCSTPNHNVTTSVDLLPAQVASAACRGGVLVGYVPSREALGRSY